MDSRMRFWRFPIVSALMLGLTGVAVAQSPGPQQEPVTSAIHASPQSAEAMVGTAITYQGQLKKGDSPVTGTCDFRFSLWDAAGSGSPPAGGSKIGADQTLSGVGVTAGLFTISSLDFGAGAFPGHARWLQIAVRCGGEADYATLAPRQAVSPVPYALSLPGLRTQLDSTSPNLIGGHISNTVSAGWHGAAIGGGGSAVWPNRAAADYGTIGGGASNYVVGSWATIGGGAANTASGAYATVGGGYYGVASGVGAFIGGGGYDGSHAEGNQALGAASAMGGGNGNSIAATGNYAFIGGGWGNHVSGQTSAIGGGYHNTVTGTDSTIAGGWGNLATGDRAMIPGGALNTAAGNYSFAAGLRAKAYNKGCFAWNDSTNADLVCNDDNVFVARATGAVIFYTNPGNTSGVWVPPGGNGWSSVSDRNLKENFTAVDGRAVLERLAQIPIATWNYKSQDPSIRHIGPTAQDFAAFGIGEDNTHISTIDADGVAMAAIQGLYQLAQEKDARVSRLEAQNASLEKRLAALEERGIAGSTANAFGGWALPGLALAVLVAGFAIIRRRGER